MAVLITDPLLEQRLKAERQATDTDHYDEVWEGVYVMAPVPNDEHQEIVLDLADVLLEVVRRPRLGKVRAGTNLSDRVEDWTDDYRSPDIAVFLNAGTARNCGTHWVGPADFLIEIVSRDDRTWEKIPFYSRLGVRELLIVDRRPWKLELHRWTDGELRLAGESSVERGEVLASSVLPLGFQLLAGEPRPQIQVIHSETGQSWLL